MSSYPKFEVKRHGASDYSNDCRAVSPGGYSASNIAGSAYDLPGMAALLRAYTGAGMQVLIEESHAMPGQGVSSPWTTGYGFGVWLGVLAALVLPHTRVRPAIWKRALGLGKDLTFPVFSYPVSRTMKNRSPLQ
jgi:hypothetical protein